MRENFIKLSHQLIFSLILTSAVTTILFFLPTTSEFFEFNKFTAILAISALGLIVWATKTFIEAKIVFTQTPIDGAILALIAVIFIASLASIDQSVSLFGNPGRIWPSFFGFAAIAALYFVAVSNLKNKKQVNVILWVLVLASTVASTVAVFSYFGAFLPFEFAKIRSFNPLGIANRLAILQALVIPLAVYWAIDGKDKITRIIATGSTLILAASFILINFAQAYIGLAVALGLMGFGMLRLKLSKNQQGTLAFLAVTTCLFLLIRFIPAVAENTLHAGQIDTPREITLPQMTAWDIAAQAIGKRPVTGTGPGTFQFVYTQLKPRNVNTKDYWNVRFEKSSSDFAELLATTGILGILAYLLFALTVLRFAAKQLLLGKPVISAGPDTGLSWALSAAIAGYLVSGFFTVSSFATTGAFFIILALWSISAKLNGRDQVYEVSLELSALKNKFAWFPIGQGNPLIKSELATSRILPSLFVAVALGASTLAIINQTNAYRAEYFYRQALLAIRSNDGNRTIRFLQKAIDANGRVDTYHRVLAQTTLNAAINLNQKGDLDENQKKILSQLAQTAIDQGKAASGYQILPLRLPGISSANVANWETISAVYQALIGTVGGAETHATNTLALAIALDPQNPILHQRLGTLYHRLGNLDLATRKFEDSITVKGDYGPGYYSLALVLIEKKGDIARIVAELTLAKRFLPADDPARGDIDKKLEEYNRQLREIQTPSSPPPGASPEPGSSPGPSPGTSPSPTSSPST